MKRSLLNECLRIAIRINPKHPEYNYYHHFSFVIQNNQIMEWGTNRGEGATPLIGYPEYSKLHSEARAYFKARGLLERGKNFEVINIRLNKRGDVRISRPCKCCSSFLKFLGCRTVWFTTLNGFAKLSL